MGVAMTYLYLSHPLMEDFPMEIYTILRFFFGGYPHGYGIKDPPFDIGHLRSHHTKKW